MVPSIEADRDGVFSGSAVVSDDNQLVAYYTGHRWRNGVNEDEGNLQVQCMAVSDDGITFEKTGVIVECPEGLLHFRDPKVWRMGDTWYMVFGACSAENRGQVWLYTSTDMKSWEFDRVIFTDPNPRVFMLECPDMFPWATSGSLPTARWVPNRNAMWPATATTRVMWSATGSLGSLRADHRLPDDRLGTSVLRAAVVRGAGRPSHRVRLARIVHDADCHPRSRRLVRSVHRAA